MWIVLRRRTPTPSGARGARARGVSARCRRVRRRAVAAGGHGGAGRRAASRGCWSRAARQSGARSREAGLVDEVVLFHARDRQGGSASSGRRWPRWHAISTRSLQLFDAASRRRRRYDVALATGTAHRAANVATASEGSRTMFTGIITDIGEVIGARGRPLRHPLALRRRHRSRSAPRSRCDGCCLTVTTVRAGRRAAAPFTVDVSNETLRARRRSARWQPGPPHQSRARAARPATSSAATSSRAMSTASPASSTSAPTATAAASPSRCPSTSRRLHRAQGLGCARRHVADGQRGERQPLRRQPHPPHLDGDDLGAQKARANRSISRSICSRAMSRGSWSSARDARGSAQLAMSRRPRLSCPRSPRSSRICATAAWSCSSMPRTARTRAISSFPRRWRRPTPINFMAKHGRGLICLALTQAARRTSCGSKSMVRAQRARATAPPSRSRSRRAKASRPASPRTTARAPSPPPSIRPRAPPTSSRRATCSRWSRARAAC